MGQSVTQTINGTNNGETINGTNKGDTIYAKGGNDTVNGGNGNDFIDAGSGNDTVNAGNGNDEVHGGTGNDTINGENGNDELYGEDGNDTIDGGNGDDLVDGGSGDDILKGGAGCDLILGGDGNDTITGGSGNDLIYGGAGTDTAIFSGLYSSYDILNILGLVLISGQDGTDLVLDVEYLKFDNGTYNVATRGFTPNGPPPQPVVSVAATDGTGTETVDGNDFTYTFTRTGDLSQALTINYSIVPAPTNGATPGVDLQPVTGTITFAAGSATAVLQFDAIDDAAAENTESFSVVVGSGVGYQVSGTNGSATGQIIDNEQTITGTPGNDDGVSNPTLVGGAGNDIINALAGDDVLIGNGGDDTLNGDAGRDKLNGGAGNDTLNGGADFDHAVYTSAAEGITVNLGAGDVTGGASVGHDTLNGIEGIKGTNFDDNIDASSYSGTSPNGGGTGIVLPGGFGIQGSFNEIEGNGGNDQIKGNGNTRISYQSATGAVTVNLQTGSASGDGSVGTDTILGGVTAVRGSNFNDSITGRSDNGTNTENFDGWGGDDSINGNGGFDRVRYDGQTIAGTNGISVNLGAGTVIGRDAAATAVVGSDTLLSIESVRATNANDIYDASTFTATSTNGGGVGDQGNFNEFEGMAGDDQITGNGNTRLVHYSAQAGITVTETGFTNPSNAAAGFNGTVTGDASIGTDTYSGVNNVRGSVFNDSFTGFNNGTAVVEQFEGYTGDDFIDGGLGLDRARYDGADITNFGVPLTNGLRFDMAAGNVTGLDASATFYYGNDTLRGIEFIRGTNAHDIYNAVGFSSGSMNAGDPTTNTFNEFEGGGGDDEITGNGNTRISYQNAGGSVTVNLALGSTAGSHASVGNDTILGGVTRVRGGNFADTITGSDTVNEILEGRGDNDTINGGAGGIDIALFSGQRSDYVITSLGVPGSSTVQDNVANRDGLDTLSNIELTEFSNAYNLNQRILDLSSFGGLTGGKQIFGTNNNAAGIGDNLTMGLNANGRFIDLADGGTDTLTLATGGGYNLNLSRVEILSGSGGNDFVTLQNPVSGMSINLNGGTDSLNLANGGNNVTVSGTESIHGGAGPDTVTLSDSTPVTINSIETVNGGSGNDQVTINADAGVTNVSASLNLDGGDDTVNLNFFGPGTVANLALNGVDHLTSAGGVQTVNLSSDTGLTSVDLGGGFHTLNLGPSDHNLNIANVFTLNSFGTHNDTINFDAGPGVNQTIDLGQGTDVLNLTGTHPTLNMNISGGSANPDFSRNLTVNDQTTGGNLELNLLNQQTGATYDFGAGNDTLHLNGSTGFTNVVWVKNIENVDSVGAGSDQIHILGNSSGVTTVTGGGGADQIYASADADNFRFTVQGDSPNSPDASGRDIVFDFDAAEDKFVFDHVPGATSIGWVETNIGGGNEVVLVDLNGDGSTDGMGNYFGYDMAIQLQNFTGPLTAANFLLI